ncbi:polyhydroxyalkanoate synthesis repressor PhaR [Alsobacter sp. KACC 23698]|uniref:Polyhydroxyalkanoate synthesis repressor PhaR n=1 Tax=Alsobacter sp. KACC 23698 TaxID=3149229 RepID=A0AAU7JD46_9HYPH
MATEKQPTVIKKYANRRLYHTGTSTYVTLDDLAGMVKKGEDFVVFDAKTGEDITRSVLTQIIFEQEGKSGQNLLPIAFLRQLIRYYGDSMQALVPSYLEHSIQMLTQNQQKFRDHLSTTFGPNTFGSAAFSAMEEQVQKNMTVFRDALKMFTPFPIPGEDAAAQPGAPAAKSAETEAGELEQLKRQLSDVQKRLDKLSG